METHTGTRARAEGAGPPAEEPAGLERDVRGWPILHAADETCDGKHPLTSEACTRSYHVGSHRTDDGSEWLDDE
ncbi:MAG TPA: hypothetical protein VGD34_11585 [Kribbella sp.]|jgi:hypothetical protein